jgi:hypothetical protein
MATQETTSALELFDEINMASLQAGALIRVAEKACAQDAEREDVAIVCSMAEERIRDLDAACDKLRATVERLGVTA